MSNGDEPAADIKIQTKAPKITPLGWQIRLTEVQAQEISQFVSSPLYRTLKTVFSRQRVDQIARAALQSCIEVKELYLYKGMATEHKMFFKALEEVKKTLDKKNEEEAKK